jgi:hypothetical protein
MALFVGYVTQFTLLLLVLRLFKAVDYKIIWINLINYCVYLCRNGDTVVGIQIRLRAGLSGVRTPAGAR